MSATGYYRRELVPMITYSDLFTFVIMLYAVATLVINITRKKQRPRSGKLRRYFYKTILPAARLHLAFGSLVKHIIYQAHRFFNLQNETALVLLTPGQFIDTQKDITLNTILIISFRGSSGKTRAVIFIPIFKKGMIILWQALEKEEKLSDHDK